MATTLHATRVYGTGHVTTIRESFLAGVLNGQIAGLIMAVVMILVFSLFLGTSIFYPVQVIGSAALGEEALVGTNFTAVLLGLIFHQLGPALLWAAVFGIVAGKLDIRTYQQALIAGLGLGVLSMIGPYVFIPFLFKTMHGVDIWNREVPMVWDWAAHLVFGASFVLYPKILNKLT